MDLEEQKQIVIQTHKYKEALHYIPLALRNATYTSKIFDEKTRALVDSIRIQRNEIKKLNEANRQLSIQTRASSIKQLKLQLYASQHRGRLTRNQEEQLKRLQRADLKRRIATLENEQAIDEIKDKGLTEEEKKLEQIQIVYGERVRTIQDAYQQEINALNNQINAKQMLIMDYYEYIEEAQRNHLSASRKYIRELENIYLQNPELGLALGYSIQKTPYHQRQAGSTRGSRSLRVEPININVSIQNADNYEIIAQKIEQGIKTGLISGVTTVYD